MIKVTMHLISCVGTCQNQSVVGKLLHVVELVVP